MEMGLPIHLPIPTPPPPLSPAQVCCWGGAAELGEQAEVFPAWAPGCCNAIVARAPRTQPPWHSLPSSVVQKPFSASVGRAGSSCPCLCPCPCPSHPPQHPLCHFPAPPVTLFSSGVLSPQEPPRAEEGGALQPGPHRGAAPLGRAHPQQVHPGGLRRCPAQRHLPGAPRWAGRGTAGAGVGRPCSHLLPLLSSLPAPCSREGVSRDRQDPPPPPLHGGFRCSGLPRSPRPSLRWGHVSGWGGPGTHVWDITPEGPRPLLTGVPLPSQRWSAPRRRRSEKWWLPSLPSPRAQCSRTVMVTMVVTMTVMMTAVLTATWYGSGAGDKQHPRGTSHGGGHLVPGGRDREGSRSLRLRHRRLIPSTCPPPGRALDLQEVVWPLGTGGRGRRARGCPRGVTSCSGGEEEPGEEAGEEGREGSGGPWRSGRAEQPEGGTSQGQGGGGQTQQGPPGPPGAGAAAPEEAEPGGEGEPAGAGRAQEGGVEKPSRQGRWRQGEPEAGLAAAEGQEALGAGGRPGEGRHCPAQGGEEARLSWGDRGARGCRIQGGPTPPLPPARTLCRSLPALGNIEPSNHEGWKRPLRSSIQLTSTRAAFRELRAAAEQPGSPAPAPPQGSLGPPGLDAQRQPERTGRRSFSSSGLRAVSPSPPETSPAVRSHAWSPRRRGGAVGAGVPANRVCLQTV